MITFGYIYTYNFLKSLVCVMHIFKEIIYAAEIEKKKELKGRMKIFNVLKQTR